MAKKPTLKEIKTVADLKPDPFNENLGTERGKELLALSLENCGFGSPPIIDADGVIGIGNKRIAQVTENNEKQPVRVIETDGTELIVIKRTDIKFRKTGKGRELALADNQVAKVSYEHDPEMLSLLLDAGVPVTDYFFDAELAALGIEVGEDPPEDAGPQIDRAAELQAEWNTARGQVWEIASATVQGKAHRLMCGDSTSETDVARLMQGEKGHMVFTDPPYGVGYNGGANNTVFRKKIIGDSPTGLYPFACLFSASFTDAEAPLYLFHAGPKGYTAAAAAAAVAAGYEIRCELIWHKTKAHYGAFCAQYMQKHESFYYCYKKGKVPRWFGPTNEVTVWDIDQPSVNEFHPTQKPPELVVRALKNSSERGHIVCDWFLGSGTTMVAAEQTARLCYGMELEPKYVAVALQRMADLGLAPKLVEAVK